MSAQETTTKNHFRNEKYIIYMQLPGLTAEENELQHLNRYKYGTNIEKHLKDH